MLAIAVQQLHDPLGVTQACGGIRREYGFQHLQLVTAEFYLLCGDDFLKVFSLFGRPRTTTLPASSTKAVCVKCSPRCRHR